MWTHQGTDGFPELDEPGWESRCTANPPAALILMGNPFSLLTPRQGCTTISLGTIYGAVCLADPIGLEEGDKRIPIDPIRFQRMKEAFARHGRIVDQSADTQVFLKLRGAEGAAREAGAHVHQ